MSKDLFSDQSQFYAKYRPGYPRELFEYIFQFVEQKKSAWDCATGNGQAAQVLADHFEKIIASDISETQIKNAIQKKNIEYQVCPAEHTPFADNSFDLITVAQAYHWLNWKDFYKEATRVGKSKTVVAIWGYNLLYCNDENVNELIQHFYFDITRPYWDVARNYVEESYKTVEFNFDPLPSKDFNIQQHWTKEHLRGYFLSWSAVQTYIKKKNRSPIDLVEKDLDKIWNDEELKMFYFPLFLRIGRVSSK